MTSIEEHKNAIKEFLDDINEKVQEITSNLQKLRKIINSNLGEDL